ncbi:general amino-acid permease GAP2 [Trichoderma asperellum]|uniref:General amino-acid permease GAP2 n=1 Tax=Trichoderma asperellum TaxID=101201 RepID=A0A6V8R5W5_TRIAP|nr:amino acid permease-domain-containing protein [Trichoderma asperelloides]GFP58023.1 general amino-acid permease GAP2 [Trichoderma asperellum]
MAPPPQDIELNPFGTYKIKEESLTHGSSYSMREPNYEEHKEPRMERIINSFRRDPNSKFFPSRDLDDIGPLESVRRHNNGSPFYDLRRAALATANSNGLSRKLKGRHLQMIAIGGSIGTGLFVASGRALAAGGPASLLIAFSIVGAMLYCTCQALGELAVIYPLAGSFSSWATRFLDPSWGFAMGWNYAMQWLTILPLEIIAASLTIGYWDENLTRAIFVTIFLATIVTINMFGVKGYGEAEFTFSLVKIVAVIGFILLGIVLNLGGTPTQGYIGGKYWHDPGAFNNGFKGLCSVFVTAAFAFTGTELIGLAAAETANPRKSLPTAIKQVFWRISLFYIVALTLVGLLVPYNNPMLVGANNADAHASPFVIAIKSAGIEVLPSLMNAVILIAVLSVGNSAVFGSSRTLAALANLGQAPEILGYVDQRGRPLVAILVAAAFGLLAFLADLKQENSVLDWLLAISGLSSILTWASICVCHIRFRRTWAARGHHPSDLPFQSQVGVAGSYVGLILNVSVLTAQFWVGAFPIATPGKPTTAAFQAENFFLKWMGAPIALLFFLSHKLYYRTSYVRIKDMDIDTGRRDFNVPILVQQEKEEWETWPKWKRFYKWMC